MIRLSVRCCIAMFRKQGCNNEVTKESLLTSLMTQLLENGKSILHRRSCSICKLKSDFSFDRQMRDPSIYRLYDRRVCTKSAATRFYIEKFDIRRRENLSVRVSIDCEFIIYSRRFIFTDIGLLSIALLS